MKCFSVSKFGFIINTSHFIVNHAKSVKGLTCFSFLSSACNCNIVCILDGQRKHQEEEDIKYCLIMT